MSRHAFDLEGRTTDFAKNVILFCKHIPRNSITVSIIGQIVRSSGSVGANYREANDALGRKDFVYRLRIVRKEAKETLHWLYLFETAVPENTIDIQTLIKECLELRNIFSAMINNALRTAAD